MAWDWAVPLCKLQGFDDTCAAFVAGYMRSSHMTVAVDDALHLLCQVVRLACVLWLRVDITFS